MWPSCRDRLYGDRRGDVRSGECGKRSDWAAALEDRVAYVIVENNLTEHTDFTYWQESEQAEEFRKRFQPAIIRLDYRLADLENAARNYGVTLGRVAGRTAAHARIAESLAGDAGAKLPAANVRRIRQGEGTASPVKTARRAGRNTPRRTGSDRPHCRRASGRSPRGVLSGTPPLPFSSRERRDASASPRDAVSGAADRAGAFACCRGTRAA